MTDDNNDPRDASHGITNPFGPTAGELLQDALRRVRDDHDWRRPPPPPGMGGATA